MNKPRRRRLAIPPIPWPAILVLSMLLGPDTRAFVFLDTSAGAGPGVVDSAARIDSSRAPDLPTPPPSPAAGPAASPDPGSTKPHFRNVLFLSAEDMLVYSHFGVIKALEEYGLGVDLLLVEGKSTLVGAAWALGYDAKNLEERLVAVPLEHYLAPLRSQEEPVDRFTPYGPDPVQVEIPLGLQTLQSAHLHWSESPRREKGEYLHLSWLLSKLTHDAPGGPVDDLKDLPRPLAVQVTDLEKEGGKVLREGPLQILLKAALLPNTVVQSRHRLWPFAPGSLVSGQAPMIDCLPFTFERLVVVQPGRRLRPPALDPGSVAWQDSLVHRIESRPPEGALPAHQVVRIELNPGAGFPSWERDPRLWMDLGYTSTLRSMDMLLALLGSRDSASHVNARPASGKPLPPPLGLNRISVNPLASGGNQLLQDILKRSVVDRGDSAGEGPLVDLVGSGYYSNLDVEWTRAPGEEDPILIFDALEKSRLLLQAGGNMVNSGEDLPDRGPEVLAGLIWSEPFYVPIRAEAALLLGGRRPGMSIRGLLAPISPLPLEVGLSLKDWRIRYPTPSGTDLDLDPRGFRLNRTRSDLFLNLMPSPSFHTGTAIQWHKLRYPEWDLDLGRAGREDERLLEPLTGTGDYQSVDFEQTALLGLGRVGPSGLFRNSLWVRYRNLNRVNLLGPMRVSTSAVETRARFSLGDFRFLDQYYWSDLDKEDPGLFEYLEAGEVSAFSFQDERFYRVLRSTHFQNIQAEYAPAFGRLGLRLLAGAFRLYGHPLSEELEIDFTRFYWEAQASYASPVGPFRLGFAGLEGGSPLFFVKVGADLDLDPQGPER